MLVLELRGGAVWKERAAVMKHIVNVRRCTMFTCCWGLAEGICLYMGSVLADVGSCSGPPVGQKGREITEEERV